MNMKFFSSDPVAGTAPHLSLEYMYHFVRKIIHSVQRECCATENGHCTSLHWDITTIFVQRTLYSEHTHTLTIRVYTGIPIEVSKTSISFISFFLFWPFVAVCFLFSHHAPLCAHGERETRKMFIFLRWNIFQ